MVILPEISIDSTALKIAETSNPSAVDIYIDYLIYIF
jgi:hypothetical protein